MTDQLAREFLQEADALVEALFDDVDSLRDLYKNGHARRDLIARIFRRVHTIKGAASAAELELVTVAAHEFESLIDGARHGSLTIDEHVIDAFEDGASAISQALTAAINGEQAISRSTLLQNFRSISLEAPSQASDLPTFLKSALPGDIESALAVHDAHRLLEAIHEGSNLFLVKAVFDLATCDVSFRALSAELARSGDIIVTVPSTEPASTETVSFTILYVSPVTRSVLPTLISPFKADLDEIDISGLRISNEQQESRSERATFLQPYYRSTNDAHTSVRVRLASLDEIVSASHDLLRQIKTVLELKLASSSSNEERKQVASASEIVRARFLELEEHIIGLRMVRAQHVLERARRAGRIVARAKRKPIDFQVFGDDVLLDKLIEEAVLSSLMHLVRNGVDHGIESSDERLSLGKPVSGQVRIEAIADGTRARFRVVDDGRGVNPERVAQVAAKLGIIEDGSKIDMEQSLRLIFHPGFSTASALSDISGRGVGLDVVERAVEQAGGKIKVSSEAGKGTAFELLMAMPLALVPSIVVRSCDQLYCIDKSCIEESSPLTAQAQRISHGQFVEWQGARLPFFEMSQLLGQTVVGTAVEEKRRLLIMNLKAIGAQREEKSKRFAVAVDATEGSHEALVWSLGRHAARWEGISGATELPDGSVSLMLDLPSLAYQP